MFPTIFHCRGWFVIPCHGRCRLCYSDKTSPIYKVVPWWPERLRLPKSWCKHLLVKLECLFSRKIVLFCDDVWEKFYWTFYYLVCGLSELSTSWGAIISVNFHILKDRCVFKSHLVKTSREKQDFLTYCSFSFWRVDFIYRECLKLKLQAAVTNQFLFELHE